MFSPRFMSYPASLSPLRSDRTAPERVIAFPRNPHMQRELLYIEGSLLPSHPREHRYSQRYQCMLRFYTILCDIILAKCVPLDYSVTARSGAMQHCQLALIPSRISKKRRSYPDRGRQNESEFPHSASSFLTSSSIQVSIFSRT